MRPAEVLRSAAHKWMADTADLPEDVAEATDPDFLRLSAAWLDFYDEVWPLVCEYVGVDNPFGPASDRGELQSRLRRIAAEGMQ